MITVAKAHKDTRGQNGKSYSGIGGRPPISHPQNCSHECPYGHDKSFCFPCYKKLVEDMRKKKETGKAGYIVIGVLISIPVLAIVVALLYLSLIHI